MSQPINVADLMQSPTFEGETPEAVAWIAERMTERRLEAGAALNREGDPLTILLVVLEGELHFQRPGADSLFVAATGEVTGLLPFSRATKWLVAGWAARASRLAVLDGAHLHDLVYRAPTVAQRLIWQMTDRARDFQRREESSARLLALGKLAAGLAHELNNPASAAVRSAARLREVLNERRAYALQLRTTVLPEKVGEVMYGLGERINECANWPGSADALDRADREADLADWLESAGAPGELASNLADAGIAGADLAPLAGLTAPETLALGLRILAADHEILCLTREVEEASRRVSDLVQAVKTYSYMDQSPVSEVDVEQGIEVTLRMFQHQLKHGVNVSLELARNLPRIRGNGSALNQIWTNIIDNSLDAMETMPKETPRELRVRTRLEPSGILVEIADNGPGIPEAIRSRIFEPFFTTKPVGEGTGLGLDIVQRIVRNHKGTILVESSPRGSTFQIRLPLDAA